MSARRRTRAWLIVAATIATALGLVATPGTAHPGESGPLVGVVFVSAWTDDDGKVDGADVYDTGAPSPGYDAWPLDPLSSTDPGRDDKDVAICTAMLSAAGAQSVDALVRNAYPGYECTLSVVVENGTALPVIVSPAVIAADPGLAVRVVSPLPATLAPGQQAPASLSVAVLQAAPPGGALPFAVTIELSQEACPGIVYGMAAGTGDIYEIDPVGLTAVRIADVVDPDPADANSPDGLAFDPGTGRFYFSDPLADGTANLYYWDGSGQHFAGNVPGLVKGAAWHAGAYYYVRGRTGNWQDLMRVTFGPGVSVTTVCPSFTRRQLNFGDLVFTPSGSVAYGSTDNPSPAFFSLTLPGCAYNFYFGALATRMNLGYGSDAVLYGNEIGTPAFVAVDPVAGTTTPTGTPTPALLYTDLASAPSCAP